jgi:alkylation response protein AidB-like acyl-CoA dehydrogenase
MQQELRAYYDKLLDPATVAELHESHAIGAAPRRIWKQMCADGWAGIGWPKEYGGQGRSAIEQFIFFDESMRAGAPVPMLTLNSVGPTIMKFGTDEQKADYLPRILSGDIHFCIGYSEPGAGTDLGSLKTRAVRDGESYIINGQKMWTSLSSDADYCWLACRTDPDAAKHKGISMIIVPMDTPGITLSPLHLLGTHDINAVFFEDVVVPAANVMGGENHGWKLITNQLNHERVTLFASGVMDRALTEVTEYAQETKLPDGRRVIDQPWVQHNLAKLQAKVEVVRLMNWQVAWEATQGVLDIGHCSALKVYGSELNMEGYQLLMEILGPVSYLEPDAPGAVLKSRIQQGTRGAIILTFGGGVNEMQRDLISQFTLGFPRADR